MTDEVKLDKRTKEYRDSHVDYDVCNDPHGIGCTAELPALDSGSPRVAKQAEPCHDCIWRNANKKKPT